MEVLLSTPQGVKVEELLNHSNTYFVANDVLQTITTKNDSLHLAILFQKKLQLIKSQNYDTDGSALA